MTRLYSVPLLAAFLMTTSAAQAQSASVLLVMRQLSDAIEGSSGETLHQAFVGHVNQGSYFSHRLRSDISSRIRIYGFCDEDCDDMDLEVVNDSGATIVRDTGTSDTPVVNFRSVAGQSYTVRARMYNCSRNPCYYSLGVFEE